MAKTLSAQDIFIDGLNNAHAMEKQALSIIEPQLDRLEHYPEMTSLLERHHRETEEQIKRLDEILETLDTSASAIKDTSMSIAGSMTALGHSVAGDEILKNSFANYAFEHFEIAAYTSLLTLAEVCGASSATSALRASLDEERKMAASLEDTLVPVTRKYVELSAKSDERADV